MKINVVADDDSMDQNATLDTWNYQILMKLNSIYEELLSSEPVQNLVDILRFTTIHLLSKCIGYFYRGETWFAEQNLP